MWPNPQFPADLVTFTEGILNGKLHFLCSIVIYFFAFISVTFIFISQLIEGNMSTLNILNICLIFVLTGFASQRDLPNISFGKVPSCYTHYSNAHEIFTSPGKSWVYCRIHMVYKNQNYHSYSPYVLFYSHIILCY